MPSSQKSLFAKNMLGVFYGGYYHLLEGRNNKFGIIAAICHTVLLPISVPLLGGIKTLYDKASRKKALPKEAIQEASEAIDALKQEELNELSAQTLKCKPSSYSSNYLVQQIMEIQHQEKMQMEDCLREPLLNYAYSIAKDIEEKHPGAKVEYLLNKADVETVKTQEAAKLAEISSSNVALLKTTFKQYISAPQNNGKKLHQFLTNNLETINPRADETTVNPANTQIYVDSGFVSRVNQQIARLRINGKWWKFGRNNNAKANRIEAALAKFQVENNAESMNALKAILDEKRIGSSSAGREASFNSHSAAYIAVFKPSR